MLLNYRENDCLDTSWYEYMIGWEEWLSEDHKKEKRQQLKASHGKLVEKVVISGEGGAGFFHMVTQPTLWRGGIQILEEVFDGADPLRKVQEIRHAWSNHWQIGTEAQKLDAKPWKIRSSR